MPQYAVSTFITYFGLGALFTLAHSLATKQINHDSLFSGRFEMPLPVFPEELFIALAFFCWSISILILLSAPFRFLQHYLQLFVGWLWLPMAPAKLAGYIVMWLGALALTTDPISFHFAYTIGGLGFIAYWCYIVYRTWQFARKGASVKQAAGWT